VYGRRDCVFVIDGMDAIEAGLHFAGVVGIDPRGKTLNLLWRMANGKIKNRRKEILELANLVWALGEIDFEAYLLYGEMSNTGRGGPVKVNPELQARIDAEVERLRQENPGLPKFRSESAV